MDENRMYMQMQSTKSNVLLSGSILSSAIFIGGALVYSSNETAGIAGMIGALAVMAIFAKFRK
jgi:hypothetical protein